MDDPAPCDDRRTVNPAADEASRALALSEACKRAIFDTATDAILTTNAAQVIVAANPAAGRLFGWAVGDLIGAPLARLIPARFREAHPHHMQAFGSSTSPVRNMRGSRPVSALRSNGEEFPIDASISHLDVDGQRLYTVILRDITQRQLIEEALRNSKAQLETALASMRDAVSISDAQGHLVDFNDAYVSFHRFLNRDECAKSLADYPRILEMCSADGQPLPLTQWAVARALRGEAASDVEYTLRRKDTGQSWVGSYSFAPLRSDKQEIIGAVVTRRDITDKKRDLAALAASRTELQRFISNQHRIQEDERRRIARELHDDLQQSLAAIRMDAVSIADRLAKGYSGADMLLTRIDKLSSEAIASTRRILNDLRPEMLEDLGLVPALEVLCARHAERTGAQCHLDASADIGMVLLGSPAISTGLYRITQEALNNVAKHAQASLVRVRIDCIHNSLVMLHISDNGKGMRTQDEPHPGSFGLRGMAERVRSLGGQLCIKSQPGMGTVIEVMTPTYATPMAADPHPGDVPPARLQDWGHPLQTVIDALAGHVAVLDKQGTIQLVNTAWREFAVRHGDPHLAGYSPGVNYLDVCRRSAQTDPTALSFLQGLSEVLAGNQPIFIAEYPCDMPDGRQWFRLHAAPVSGGLVITTHIDLSSRIARPSH